MVLQLLFQIFHHALFVVSYYAVNMVLATGANGYLWQLPFVRTPICNAGNIEFVDLVYENTLFVGPATYKIGQADTTRCAFISKQIVM